MSATLSPLDVAAVYNVMVYGRRVLVLEMDASRLSLILPFLSQLSGRYGVHLGVGRCRLLPSQEAEDQRCQDTACAIPATPAPPTLVLVVVQS